MKRAVRRPKEETLRHMLQQCVGQSLLSGLSSLTKRPSIVYVSAGTSLTQQDRVLIKRLLLETKLDGDNASPPPAFSAVLFKEDLLQSKDGWRVSRHTKNATNHYEAASDLLVLQKAAAVVTADFSTFARFLQFHRCQPQPFRHKVPSGKVDPKRNLCSGQNTADTHSIYTYDQYYNSLVGRGCCDPFTGGLESTPFALMQHYENSETKKDSRGGKLICKPPV